MNMLSDRRVQRTHTAELLLTKCLLVFKSRGVIWAGHVAHMEGENSTMGFGEKI